MARAPEQTPDSTAAGPAQAPAPRWAPAWVWALVLLPLALFAYAAWSARWVRPGGDDWCFIPVVRDHGLPGMVDKFYLVDNGRVVNAVLVWAYARFDVAGQQWFAPITAVVILGLLWAAVAAALSALRTRAPRGVAFLVAAMVTALFLFASANTYHTFYWPAASVTHTLPPVFACAAAVPALRARSRPGKAFALLVLFVVCGLDALLSEETSVVTLVVLGAALLISGIVFPAAHRRFGRWCCVTGIAGVVTGTLILYTSPGATHRRETHASSEMLTPDSLMGSLRVFAHVVITSVTNWQYAGALAVGLLLGLLARGPWATRALGRADALIVATGVVVLLVAGYACTVIAYPVFGHGVLGRPRLWNDYLLPYVLFLVLLGALAARAWRSRASATRPVTAVAAAVCVLVCGSLALSLTSLETDMAARAHAWDRQDRAMRAQAAAGVRVLPYKRLVIRHMTEPFGHGPRVQTWPANCVADYYRVDRIYLAGSGP
jgi:hypothetical protein